MDDNVIALFPHCLSLSMRNALQPTPTQFFPLKTLPKGVDDEKTICSVREMSPFSQFSLLLLVVDLCVGCYITNCPPGGKRSGIPEHNGQTSTRQCSACGPGGIGRCYGPDICCSPRTGCFVGTRESAICRVENMFPLPCQNEGRPCGNEEGGRCSANGLCCSTDQCKFDETCKGKRSPSRNYLYQRMLDNQIDLNENTDLKR